MTIVLAPKSNYRIHGSYSRSRLIPWRSSQCNVKSVCHLLSNAELATHSSSSDRNTQANRIVIHCYDKVPEVLKKTLMNFNQQMVHVLLYLRNGEAIASWVLPGHQPQCTIVDFYILLNTGSEDHPSQRIVTVCKLRKNAVILKP